MEYDNINISYVEKLIEKRVKKQLETLMKIEYDQYLKEKQKIKKRCDKCNNEIK